MTEELPEYNPEVRMAPCEDEDACEFVKLEIEFAIPVLMTQDQQRRLLEWVDELTKAPCNSPKHGVHWVSSLGSKPKWSAVDAALLGKKPAPGAPLTGEPDFDEEVFHIETFARGFVSLKERWEISARAFAVKAHGSQLYGTRPYVYHLDEVVTELTRLGFSSRAPSRLSPVAVAVGYLHDVLEDTEASPEDIRKEFGDYVLQQVEAITDPPGPTRKERKRLLYVNLAKLGGEFTDALVVKLVDRLVNVRQAAQNNQRLLAMYQAEHAEFKSAVQRPGVCLHLWEELDSLFGYDNVTSIHTNEAEQGEVQEADALASQGSAEEGPERS